jgi:hypothetical protein
MNNIPPNLALLGTVLTSGLNERGHKIRNIRASTKDLKMTRSNQKDKTNVDEKQDQNKMLL